MMEDETDGKGPERWYKINMVDTNERSSEESDWMIGIIDFLLKSILLENKAKARRMRLKATRYALIRGVLYRKSFSGPLLRCLTEKETVEVLDAIHSGVCGNHSGGRSLAHKAITAGYFWPYMMQDAMKFVKNVKNVKSTLPWFINIQNRTIRWLVLGYSHVGDWISLGNFRSRKLENVSSC